MKLGLVLVSVFGLVAMTGHAIVREQQPVAEISVPTWLGVADQEHVTSVELLGAPGEEQARGNVLLDLPSDGKSEMSWLSNTLAKKGYVITPVNQGFDNFMGAVDVVRAADPVTGRSIVVSRVERPDGSLLNLSFTDPLAEL